jgi:hypothetical protein
MGDDDNVADADLDRVVRDQAKRYDFAAVNDPVSKLTDFARLLRAGPANDIAEIAHRQTHPLGSLHFARSGDGASSAGATGSSAIWVKDGFRPDEALGWRDDLGSRPMTEGALGIAGLVLLLLALMMLALRPRRSRPLVETGLAIGAGLLGVAAGLVVADRQHPPPPIAAAAPAVAPAPAEPAPPGYVESRLSLQFPIDDEYPTSTAATNVFDWYVLRNSINYVPAAGEKLDKPQNQLLKLLTDVSWSWLIVVVFDRPTQYGRLQVSFAGGQLPFYQITRQNPRYAVIHVQGRIPAGEMDIATSQ